MLRSKFVHYLIPNLGALLVLALVLTGGLGAARQSSQESAPPASSQATTTTISYQGHLTDAYGQSINDQALPMTFALYAAPSGGTAVWSESHNGVPVTNGLFYVLLGSQNPIDLDLLSQELWLGISVGGDAEMIPRERIHSVPYAARVLPGAIDGRSLAASGFGSSGSALQNFVSLPQRQQVIFTANSSEQDWTTVDLSAYLPPSAAAAVILVAYKDTDPEAGELNARFDRPGMPVGQLVVTAVRPRTVVQGIVGVSDQQLAYRFDASGSNTATLDVYLIGYFEAAHRP